MLAKKEGLTRGWFTYTELSTLAETVCCQALFRLVASLFAILLATYTAGLLTIIGSMFIVSHIPGNCLQSKTNLLDTKAMVTLDDANCYDCDDLINNNEMHRKLDAVDVLQTSIILASIKREDLNNKTIEDDNVSVNVEYITWNWWESPTMNWLSSTSKLMEQFLLIPTTYNFNENYKEIYNMNNKMLDLEDQIHKGSKIRIQDQMEMSWHKEWTDTIKNNLIDYNLFNYFQDVTS